MLDAFVRELAVRRKAWALACAGSVYLTMHTSGVQSDARRMRKYDLIANSYATDRSRSTGVAGPLAVAVGHWQ
jgi:hypothetical protein